MKKGEADGITDQVMAELDDEIADALADVAVYIVDGRGDPELRDAIRNAGLTSAAIPENFRGVFLGTQATESADGEDGGATAEGSIVLNARNLATAEDVRDTLAHEIGHALGMSEEEVENLGLG